MAMHHNPADPELIELERIAKGKDEKIIQYVENEVNLRQKEEEKKGIPAGKSLIWENGLVAVRDIAERKHLTARYVLYLLIFRICRILLLHMHQQLVSRDCKL